MNGYAPWFGLIGVLVGAAITQTATHRREMWSREESRRGTQRRVVSQALAAINQLPVKVKALSYTENYPLTDPGTGDVWNYAGQARHSGALVELENALIGVDQALRECRMTVTDGVIREELQNLEREVAALRSTMTTQRVALQASATGVDKALDRLSERMLAVSSKAEMRIAPQSGGGITALLRRSPSAIDRGSATG
ncbi:hypothetical protein [Antrihabitans spumae]|uniref:Uncharacterized protein n=1 Tax=Antrihabitans spumae TaxID=3373370 RepID=A0ABW7KTL5_9NOCA